MNERSTAVEQFRLSRRSLLGLGAASALGGIAAGPITRVLQYGDSIRFMLDRRSWNTEENSYFPPVPDNILSREASDRILDALNLVAENQYSHTITPEAFQVIIQRPARIASLYFHPNENKTLQETDRDFADHCVRFFTAMKSQADFMETDFIATLLMYQVSGDANSTQRAFNKDIMEERVRVALNIARKELGPIASDALINILRETELLDFAVPYYAMPRLEGVVTMGIHDIETVITARSLRDFEQTLPDKWIQVAHYLKTRAPKFFSQYGSYAEMYDQFEAESEQLKQDLMSLPQFGEYLSRLYTPEVMRRILTTDDQVDAYQLQRTTLFWANVSEINVKNGFAMQAPGRKRTEQQALERTLQQYVQAGSPIPFFLDQILNPKILQMISADANRGNTTAQELLARCK
ncbi:hypothetical protein HYS29_00685, partial [Candidatus Microgenomates bacterium]|nr:hypothetical protein [Candidatus Microgenomates bacterium]